MTNHELVTYLQNKNAYRPSGVVQTPTGSPWGRLHQSSMLAHAMSSAMNMWSPWGSPPVGGAGVGQLAASSVVASMRSSSAMMSA